MSMVDIDTNIGLLRVDNRLLNLMRYYKLLNSQKMDRVIIIDGSEGSGKSNLAMTSGGLLDSDFELHNIFWSTKRLIECVKDFDPASSLIYDEATLGFSSKEFATKASKRLENALRICRQYRHNIFLLIPNFLFLNTYARTFRACNRFYCQTYFDNEGIHRGSAEIQEPSKNKFKKEVYYLPVGYCNFHTVPRPFERKYEKKKEQATYDYLAEDTDLNLTYNQIMRAIKDKCKAKGITITGKTKLYEFMPSNILYEVINEDKQGTI